MAAHLELIIPLIFAINSAWTDYRQCTGPAHAAPLVENMCGDLRLSLNDKCSALLSVPLGPTGLVLDSGISITQGQFSDMTKNSIKASYASCTKFWSGDIGQDEYANELLGNASTLTLLYHKLGPRFDKKQDELLDLLASQGMSVTAFKEASRPEKALEKACREPGACTLNGPAAPPTLPDPDPSIDLLRESVKAEIQKTNARVAELERLQALPTPPPPTRQPKRHVLVTETNFETGKATFRNLDICAAFAERIAPYYTDGARLVITGYADHRGDMAKNMAISDARAVAAAQCVANRLHIPLEKIIASGKGILPMASTDLQGARKATVHLEMD